MGVEKDTFAMSRQSSFEGVLTNSDDLVFTRELLKMYVPLHVQEKIIDEFNIHVDNYNGRNKPT